MGWRNVPVAHEVVGRFAKVTQPRIFQVVVEGKPGQTGVELERELFILRKLVERAKAAQLPPDVSSDFYICSLSNKTIVYKGMLRSVVVGSFFLDLQNPNFETSFAIYHRRFSTNTTPKWPLAQPMRVLGHNGEINTLQGNLNWVASREHQLDHPVWKGRVGELTPLCDSSASDSANLDRVAELLVRTGFDIPESLMLLVPGEHANIHITLLSFEQPSLPAYLFGALPITLLRSLSLILLSSYLPCRGLPQPPRPDEDLPRGS